MKTEGDFNLCSDLKENAATVTLLSTCETTVSKKKPQELTCVFIRDFYFVGGTGLLAAGNVGVTEAYFSVTVDKNNISYMPKL